MAKKLPVLPGREAAADWRAVEQAVALLTNDCVGARH
jgi:hypothetical protein